MTPATDPDDAQPSLRADAERNRTRLLVAPRQVFAEQGLDVPMTVIARHAGVGIATLYRRFPTREDLIGAVSSTRWTPTPTPSPRHSPTRTPGTAFAPTSSASAPCRPPTGASPTSSP